MASILVRLTVALPAPLNGPALPVGSQQWVNTDDPYVSTQLSVGHMVPVGKIPPLPQPTAADDPS